MRTCPHCHHDSAHDDGYCGHCRQTTLEPLPASAPEAPRDQQWLQEICELVKNKMPESHVYVVFAFPHTAPGRCYYASNAERDSARAALREWLDYQDNIDNWMKHTDGGPPPPAPWPNT